MELRLSTGIRTLTFILLMSGIFLSACSKKEGCLDQNAANFDNDVGEDNGSCLYDLSIILGTAIHFSTDIYVDDNYKGTLNYIFTGVAPGCGKDTFIGYTPSGIELSGVINTAVTPGDHQLRVVAVDGTEWVKTYTITNNCMRIIVEDGS